MNFWKMNGAGNDFVLIDDMSRSIADARLPALARRLCSRRLSLGADGLMVLRPAERGGDFKMLFFNEDGSVGEMCGNGARCVCRYGAENGLAPPELQRVETGAGLVTGYPAGGNRWKVRLNDPTVVELSHPVELDGSVNECAYVELGHPGSPHAVMEMPGLRRLDPAALLPLAKALRFDPSFPRGANVTFYEQIGPERVFLRTYERGVEDFTWACGTGTGSTVLVLAMRGAVPGGADAEMRGGVLRVDVDFDGEAVRNLWLTGPTVVAARGALDEECLAGME
ncbi:MAG: diaminopimelate epimerase [Oscillospiraceae bacterium]|nr:diaminopimelate epimerase [Oscillospiraceae bacterium]